MARSSPKTADDLIGDLVRNQLIYYSTVTRDPFRNCGRIMDLMISGKPCWRAAVVDGADEVDDGGVGDALFGGLLDDALNKFRVAALCPANPSRWTLVQEG
jgi:hypothetical protein